MTDLLHIELRDQLRRLAEQHRDVLVPATDLVKLLDLIDHFENLMDVDPPGGDA